MLVHGLSIVYLYFKRFFALMNSCWLNKPKNILWLKFERDVKVKSYGVAYVCILNFSQKLYETISKYMGSTRKIAGYFPRIFR